MIGALFRMYLSDRPREVDYVLIPEHCITPFVLVPRPDRSVPPDLGERHYEIEGMGDVEGASLVLARAILADDSMVVEHLREGDVVRLAVKLVADEPGRNAALTGEWRQALADWKPPR